MKSKALAIAALLTLPIGSAHAGFVSWTDWTTATVGKSATATGAISIGTDTIGVTYTGEIAFAELGSVSIYNYWSEEGEPKPYTGNSVVDNAPTAYEMIALQDGAVTNTLTFATAVRNPIMAIVSMGRPDLPVAYDFDSSFTVLSNGIGFWSFANNGLPALLTVSAGDILTGNEAHAAIQFLGTFSSISWVVDRPEYWHGITVGLTQDALIPEPTTLALLGLGLAGLSAVKRKKLPS
jgi:hypothetical protein